MPEDPTVSYTALATLDETGRPPKSRISDADALRALIAAIWDDDSKSSKDRAAIDAMFGGEPPYRQADLDEMGQGERTNLNFNEALALAEQAEAGYYDLTNSVRELVSVKTSFGNPVNRAEWESTIAEEFTTMVREWPSFEFHFQNLVRKFVRHGVGVTLFEDEIDWRFVSCGFDRFKIPRNTPANEEAVEVAIAESPILAHQLYRIISKKHANRAGWNVRLARKAIISSVNQNIPRESKRYTDWEKLERDIQNNDLAYGHARSSEIRLIHAWVQEFDGRVSHYITTEEGNGDDFLFNRVGRYGSVHQSFTIYPYGIGNGFYHSIRGLGYKIFSHIAVSNRLQCSVVDGAIASSTTVVQPIDQTPRALEDLITTTIGPWSVLPPGLKVIERSMSNFGQNVMPVLNNLSMQLQNVAGGYSIRAVTPEGQPRTAYEIRAQQLRDAVLSASSVNLFYVPWARTVREMFRRAASRSYRVSDPGGKEVMEMRKRLSARGVPLEAMYRVYSVTPVRSIGSGSAAMRVMALDEAMSLSGSMDEVGRDHLVRDRLAARFGYDSVDRYKPAPNALSRQPVDVKIAEIENSMLRQGQPVSVQSGENHKVHADAVLNLLTDIITAIRQRQMSLPEALTTFQVAIPHAEQHVALVSQDRLHAQEAGLMRKALQQISASAQRVADEFQAQQEAAAEEQMAEQARRVEEQQAYVRDLESRVGQDGASPDLQKELMSHQFKLQKMREEWETERQIRLDKANQDRALKDAAVAADIRRKMAPSMLDAKPEAGVPKGGN